MLQGRAKFKRFKNLKQVLGIIRAEKSFSKLLTINTGPDPTD